ncbi:MAG: nitroreductase family protein [Muribaculaceae bacterium]
MKYLLFTIMIALTSCATAQNVELPAPQTEQKSLSMVETLKTRHSVRDYDKEKSLTLQEISNVCWAANGVSRDAEHRTAPSAMNRQEIRLFVFTEKAVYEYIAPENILELKAEGDHRRIVAGTSDRMQEFVLDAPVSLVMVIDLEKFGMEDEKARMFGCVDAGNVSENINLYCQSVGLATVPRATMDVEAIRVLLGLGEKQIPIMNNPIGYAK